MAQEDSSNFLRIERIKTAHGIVRAQVIGRNGDPVVLFVHGSGPQSSSDDWLSPMQSIFLSLKEDVGPVLTIAFDCPGYGESVGLRQAIRSFPTEVISSVLSHFSGSSSPALALCGCSQGGCAVLNALLEQPSLASCAVMDRPVFGPPRSLAKLSVPVLLLFDVDDPGHPVKAGRLMNKFLRHSKMVEFSGNTEPFFWADRLPTVAASFIAEHVPAAMSSSAERRCSCSPATAPASPRQLQPRRSTSPVKSPLATPESGAPPATSSTAQTPKKPRATTTTTTAATVPQSAPQDATSQATSTPVDPEPAPRLEEAPSASAPICAAATTTTAVSERVEHTATSLTAAEDLIAEFSCPVCLSLLVDPVVTPCRHRFCLQCLVETIEHAPVCPLCRAEIRDKPVIDDETKARMAAGLSPEIIAEREREVKEAAARRKMLAMVRVEVGNTSQLVSEAHGSARARYRWKLFVAVSFPETHRGMRAEHVFEKVSVNLNPGVTVGQIQLVRPPFELEREGTYTFDLTVTLHWRRHLGMKPAEIAHLLEVGPARVSRTSTFEFDPKLLRRC